MTRWARLVFLSLASLLLLGEGALARDSCVTLYSVTHLQSQLLPVKIGEKKAGTFVGGLAQAAGLVLRDRARHGNSIFFTAGECLAGTQWRYFRGEPEMKVLAASGVAVKALGKHEFDYGVDYLKTALSHNDLPVVVSNLEARDPGLTARLRKNLVLQAGKVRVGFFGLLSPAVMRTTVEPEGVSFDPDLNAVARRMVEDLRRQGAELIVLLSGLYERENIALARLWKGCTSLRDAGSPRRTIAICFSSRDRTAERPRSPGAESALGSSDACRSCCVTESSTGRGRAGSCFTLPSGNFRTSGPWRRLWGTIKN